MNWIKSLFIIVTTVILARCELRLRRNVVNFPGSRSGLHSSCRLASGETGTCRPISECPAVLNELRSISPTHCGWKGIEPLICCPGPSLASENTCATSLSRTTRQAQTFNKSSTKEITIPNTATDSKSPLIIGGRLSPPNGRPWMAAIAWKINNLELEARDKLQCGGTLIGTHYILTAAHCFDSSKNPADFEVHLGTNYLNSTHDGLDIASIIVHPNFAHSVLYSDIALVKLKSGVSFSQSVRPTCLPMGSLRGKNFEDAKGMVTGWGHTENAGTLSLALREVQLNIVPNERCDKIIASIPLLFRYYPKGAISNIMCAGVEEGGKDACQGDSGGPLVWSDPTTNKWVILGVVSGGYRCGEPGIPGIYTRVTTYLDWIIRNAV